MLNYCYSCEKEVSRMYLRFRKDGSQVCNECALNNSLIEEKDLFSPEDLDSTFSGFVISFEHTFICLCGLLDEGRNILDKYNVLFKICYVSNKDENTVPQQEMDQGEEKEVIRYF